MSSLPAYLLFLLLTDKTKHTGDLAKGTQFEKRLSLPDTGGGLEAGLTSRLLMVSLMK